MKRIMCFLAALAALATGVAASTAKEHRVVFQVDQNDPAVMNLTLNNVSNLIAYYNHKGEQLKVEVVAFGPGLNMLRQDKSPVIERLKHIKNDSLPASVQFSACHNTMMGMEKNEGHPIPIVSEATVVPSGVVRLSELQEEGWSYIRP
jgi:intracellular sulfur oxidation DsrE/DsrF family protein